MNYAQVDQVELEAHDGVAAGKYTIGLGQASDYLVTVAYRRTSQSPHHLLSGRK